MSYLVVMALMTLIVVKGSNLVSSGRLDLNNDGDADLDIVESSWKTTSITKHLR